MHLGSRPLSGVQPPIDFVGIQLPYFIEPFNTADSLKRGDLSIVTSLAKYRRLQPLDWKNVYL